MGADCCFAGFAVDVVTFVFEAAEGLDLVTDGRFRDWVGWVAAVNLGDSVTIDASLVWCIGGCSTAP